MAVNYQGGNDAVVTGAFQPMMQTMQRNYLLQQEQAQAQRKERSKLISDTQQDIAKVNANGLRTADLKAFNKGYGEIKDMYFNLTSSTNPEEIRNLRMQINNKIGELGGIVYDSKEKSKLFNSGYSSVPTLAGKGKPEDYKSELDRLNTLPSSQLDASMFDKTPYLDKWDFNKVQTSLRNLGNTLKKSPDAINSTQVMGTYNVGDRKYADVNSVTRSNPNSIISGLSNLYWNDKNFTEFVRGYMSENGIEDINLALEGIYEQNRGFFEESSNSRVNASRGGITINMPQPVPEDIQSTYSSGTVGAFSYTNSTPLKETITLIGQEEVYDSNGNRVNANFKNFDVKTGKIITLPVDSQGRPLPTDSEGEALQPNLVDGTRTFVPTVIPQESLINVSGTLDAGILNMLSSFALIPSGRIQRIGASKAKRSDIRSYERANTTTGGNSRNNSVTSQTTAPQKPKFN